MYSKKNFWNINHCYLNKKNKNYRIAFDKRSTYDTTTYGSDIDI